MIEEIGVPKCDLCVTDCDVKRLSSIWELTLPKTALWFKVFLLQATDKVVESVGNKLFSFVFNILFVVEVV